MPKRSSCWILTALNFLTLTPDLYACYVCFGNADTPQAKAIIYAVLTLAGIVTAVLGAIAYLAFRWSKRAKEWYSLTDQRH